MKNTKNISNLPLHKQIALGAKPKGYKGMQGSITGKNK